MNEYIEDITLPKAIIVDIDGTLAHRNDRSPFNWKRVIEDSCNETIKKISNSYNGHVLIFTGRDAICKDDTIYWLEINNIKFDKIFMREINNNESDAIIKKRLFEENVRGKYFIEYVLDDRDQVVKMWRSLGLICLQVAEGNF